jgi:tetratricopeptide (TPR) repeat protein
VEDSSASAQSLHKKNAAYDSQYQICRDGYVQAKHFDGGPKMWSPSLVMEYPVSCHCEPPPLDGAFGRLYHFDDAVRMLREILEIDPTNLGSLWALGEIYEKKDMFPKAIEQYEKAVDATRGNEFIPYALLASAYAGSGQTGKAEEILRELNRKFGEDKWISAAVHARMGRKEQAIHELTDDEADCGPGTCGPAASLYISNWRFDPLHSDARFQGLLRKFNYPP